MAVTLNASTSSGFIQTADTSGDLALQSNGTTQLTVSSTGAYGQIKSGTAVASTSGTSIDFTSIPSWVKRITVMFSGVSTSGTSIPLIQVGAGSVTSSGYVAAGASFANTITTSTAGFIQAQVITAAGVYNGRTVISLVNSATNLWMSSGIYISGTVSGNASSGNVTLSGTLDRVRITTVNGTDTFDAGTINILYEG
jgi:hypothetical protein